MSLDLRTTLGAALLGYLIGALSFARIVASRVSPGADISHVSQVVPGTDITFIMRTVSATSVHTHVGKRYGCLTALLDMIKVALPTLLVRQAFPDQPYYLITAACGVVGHNWPVLLGFKGGKGVATTVGVMLFINPFLTLICFIIGLAIAALTRLVSLGSIIGMALAPLAAIIFVRPFDFKLLLFCLFISSMSIFWHKENIKRLIKGNENKL
jgi:glycerol-3-phosphate acyltransferase PlsY